MRWPPNGHFIKVRSWIDHSWYPRQEWARVVTLLHSTVSMKCTLSSQSQTPHTGPRSEQERPLCLYCRLGVQGRLGNSLKWNSVDCLAARPCVCEVRLVSVPAGGQGPGCQSLPRHTQWDMSHTIHQVSSLSISVRGGPASVILSVIMDPYSFCGDYAQQCDGFVSQTCCLNVIQTTDFSQCPRATGPSWPKTWYWQF